ncbi:MAG: hypothetical protein M0015_02895 [Betaproteobacteria bacterium]|nr:hypothetical protein [Betaproteobacteria bacterium]
MPNSNPSLPDGYFCPPILDMCPDLKHMGTFDPDNLTAAEVLKIITIALANACNADPLARLKAESVMNEQYSRGAEYGRKQGFDNGYRRGYLEGLDDGRKEVLDKTSAEEAERAILKTAARARRCA